MEVDATSASTESQASTSCHSSGYPFNLICELYLYIFQLLLFSLWNLLELICLQEMENTVGISETNWEDPQIVPHCLSSQLRTCLFRDFRGSKNDIQFAEYVMQNSKALCTMTIHSVCSVDINAKYQMLQKLVVYPRACKLIFDWWG